MKFLLVLLFIISTLSCNRNLYQPSNYREKPNIVFIMVDDLGKEWVSCYGSDDIHTPHIDALAESGTIFHNVYSMPQCTPTRLTLLTGQYPFRHGWVNHWDVPRWGGGAHFDESLYPSLGLEMKRAGYSTCIAGKWQIDDFRVEPDALFKNGFDEYCMWTGYEAGIPESAERYQEPYLFTRQGSQTYNGKFGPDVFKNFIIEFINRNRKSPFFVYYPMVLTHTPFVNTPDEREGSNFGKHKAMVRYTDKITGEIVNALDNAGVRNNTVIIWTTDNGTTGQIEGRYKSKLVKGGKMKTFEAGIAAPFIVSWPKKMKPNQESKALIDFTDLFPTFLDLAGREIGKFLKRDEPHFEIDGQSFKNVLTNKSKESNREWIMSMGGANRAKLTDQGVENEYIFRDRVLRNRRFKLYIDTNRRPEKFFDLENDPFEVKNIISELNTSIRKENFDQLNRIIESFPEKDNDPQYHPNPSQPWDVKVTAQSEVWKK